MFVLHEWLLKRDSKVMVTQRSQKLRFAKDLTPTAKLMEVLQGNRKELMYLEEAVTSHCCEVVSLQSPMVVPLGIPLT